MTGTQLCPSSPIDFKWSGSAHAHPPYRGCAVRWGGGVHGTSILRGEVIDISSGKTPLIPLYNIAWLMSAALRIVSLLAIIP